MRETKMTKYTIGHGSRSVVVVGKPRRISGGSVVTVAWESDNASQLLADGTIHPAHRAGFRWDEPVENLRPVR